MNIYFNLKMSGNCGVVESVGEALMSICPLIKANQQDIN